jgi:hypothetical protein
MALMNVMVVFALVVSFLLSRLPVQLPFEEVRALAQQYHDTPREDKEPLKGKIAIVTGSTSGLGQCLASELYQVIQMSYIFIDILVSLEQLLSSHRDLILNQRKQSLQFNPNSLLLVH